MRQVFSPFLVIAFVVYAPTCAFAQGTPPQSSSAPLQLKMAPGLGAKVVTPTVDPAAEVYNSAIQSYKAGHIDDAITKLRNYVSTKPNDPNALGLLGYLELLQGQDVDQASSDMAQAIKLNPRDFVTRKNYVSALLQQKRFPDALEQLKIIAQAQPTDLRTQARLATTYAETGDYALSLVAFQKIISKPNLPAQIIKNYALTLAHLNKLPDAAKYYDRAASIDPTDAGSWTSAGMIYARIGKQTDAARCLGEALKLGPTDPFRTRFVYATALAETGRSDEAIKQFKYVTVLKPDEFEAWYDLGILQEKQGLNDDAIASYRQANQLNPNELRVLVNLSGLLIKMGNASDAVSELAGAVKTNPDQAPLHVLLGAAYFETNDPTDGAAEWKAALALSPSDTDTRSRLAEFYSSTNDWTNALDQYNILLKQMPKSDAVLTQQGEALLQLKQYSDAAAALQAAIYLNPKNATAYNNLGAAHERLKEYSVALAEYKKAAALDPSLTEAQKNYIRLANAESAPSSTSPSTPAAPVAPPASKPASTLTPSPGPTAP